MNELPTWGYKLVSLQKKIRKSQHTIRTTLQQTPNSVKKKVISKNDPYNCNGIIAKAWTLRPNSIATSVILKCRGLNPPHCTHNKKMLLPPQKIDNHCWKGWGCVSDSRPSYTIPPPLIYSNILGLPRFSKSPFVSW